MTTWKRASDPFPQEIQRRTITTRWTNKKILASIPLPHPPVAVLLPAILYIRANLTTTCRMNRWIFSKQLIILLQQLETLKDQISLM